MITFILLLLFRSIRGVPQGRNHDVERCRCSISSVISSVDILHTCSTHSYYWFAKWFDEVGRWLTTRVLRHVHYKEIATSCLLGIACDYADMLPAFEGRVRKSPVTLTHEISVICLQLCTTAQCLRYLQVPVYLHSSWGTNAFRPFLPPHLIRIPGRYRIEMCLGNFQNGDFYHAAQSTQWFSLARGTSLLSRALIQVNPHRLSYNTIHCQLNSNFELLHPSDHSEAPRSGCQPE